MVFEKNISLVCVIVYHEYLGLVLEEEWICTSMQNMVHQCKIYNTSMKNMVQQCIIYAHQCRVKEKYTINLDNIS